MNVKMHYVHFDADVKLVEFINQRVDRLEHFSKEIIDVDIFLKLEKTSHSHINDKVAEIKINIPHHQFFVKETSKTFEDAFVSALESVINQIKK